MTLTRILTKFNLILIQHRKIKESRKR